VSRPLSFLIFELRIFIKEFATKEKLVPVLSERSEVTKRNPAFQKFKICGGKIVSGAAPPHESKPQKNP